jgi:hypothetical protein
MNDSNVPEQPTPTETVVNSAPEITPTVDTKPQVNPEPVVPDLKENSNTAPTPISNPEPTPTSAPLEDVSSWKAPSERTSKETFVPIPLSTEQPKEIPNPVPASETQPVVPASAEPATTPTPEFVPTPLGTLAPIAETRPAAPSITPNSEPMPAPQPTQTMEQSPVSPAPAAKPGIISRLISRITGK